MGDAIISCAVAPLKRTGKSVQLMANRLDKLEDDLTAAMVGAESKQLATRFGLVGSKNGGLRSRLLKITLIAATQYEVSIGGFSGSFDMVRLAWTCGRAKLTTSTRTSSSTSRRS